MGTFYCDRLVSQGDNHLTSHQLMDQIIANELSGDDLIGIETDLAIAIQLSLEIGNPTQARRCTANDPCMACICLTRHSDEYL